MSKLRSWKPLAVSKCSPTRGSSAKLRPDELSRALSYLRQGDALIVTRLDRLARSTPNLYNVLQAVAQAGASVTSLGDPWINTAGTHGELMLTILRGIADFETGLMKRGTGKGEGEGRETWSAVSSDAGPTARKQSSASLPASRGGTWRDLSQSVRPRFHALSGVRCRL